MKKFVNKCKHLFWSKNRSFFFFFNIYSANCSDLKSHENWQKVRQAVRHVDFNLDVVSGSRLAVQIQARKTCKTTKPSSTSYK